MEEEETMRKTRRKLPAGICQRKDGRFQGRFTFNGQRYTLYDRDLDELEKKMRSALYEMEHGIYGKLTNLTLDQWFEFWLEEYKVENVKNSTIILYSTSYERYVKETLGGKKLDSIKPLHIQKLYNTMKQQGLSTGTIQIVNSILNNIFTQAVKNDLILKNPCYGAIMPKGVKKERRVMTSEEQKVFLKEIEGDFYGPICMLALATGLRIGELTALRWEDIDFEEHLLSVNRTLLYQPIYGESENVYQLQSPKSENSRRVVPMIPDVEKMLKKHRKEQMEYMLYKGSEWTPVEELGDLVFTTRKGTPVQEVYLVKYLKRVTNRLNEKEEIAAAKDKREPVIFEPITPHTLRHTFATRAFEHGMMPKTVQEILGHSNLSITMDLYTHVTNDTKIREMKKIVGVLR